MYIYIYYLIRLTLYTIYTHIHTHTYFCNIINDLIRNNNDIENRDYKYIIIDIFCSWARIWINENVGE